MTSPAVLLSVALGLAGGGVACAADASQLAAACASCHAAGDVGGIPRIAGSDASLIEFSLLAYRSGQRESQVMRVVARALSLEEITAIARYLSAQELARR